MRVAVGLWVAALLAAILIFVTPAAQSSVRNLDGWWEFVWRELVEPEGFAALEAEAIHRVPVPGAWNGYDLPDSAGAGYGTFRIVVPMDPDWDMVTLRIPRIHTAYRLWVNGQERARAGVVGTSLAESQPEYRPQQITVPLDGPEIELVIQVSNFHHRSGGLMRSIEWGEPATMDAGAQRRLAYDLFLFGSLLAMGLYHVILYAFRRRDLALLFFGLFCFLVSLRTITVGENFLVSVLPQLSWETAHTLQTTSYYAGVGIMVLFFRHTFPQQVSAAASRIVVAVASVSSLVVVLLPARHFTPFNPLYQVFTLAVIAYVAHALMKVVRRQEVGASYIGWGAAVLFATVLHDMAFLSVLRADHQWLSAVIHWGNLSSMGLLAFVFAQSMVLAKRYAAAFDRSELLGAELQRWNERLEAEVAERTEDVTAARVQLEAKNRELERLSLEDPLTKLWNRRHFDDSLDREWRRCQRHQKPLAILFVDIDDFKPFNDRYGHTRGDRCLQAVSECLKQSFSRAEDLPARYGGEEFVVLLPNMTEEEAAAKGETLRQAIEQKTVFEQCPVTVSIGVSAAVPRAGLTPADLLRQADEAMYEAKSQGKNQVAVCSQIRCHKGPGKNNMPQGGKT